MPNPTPIVWKLDDNAINTAIYYACNKVHHSVDRANMNPRAITERLDDKVMGDIATMSVAAYLQSKGVVVYLYDAHRTDNFHDPDPGWDVAYCMGNVTTPFQNPRALPNSITLSVRSSRIPKADGDDITTSIKKRDFKIFAYPSRSLEMCISADIETQVYYKLSSSQLSKEDVSEALVLDCIRNPANCLEIRRRLRVDERYGESYLTAWNTKKGIIEYSKTLRQPVWASFHQGFEKRMWIAPLREGYSFEELTQARLDKAYTER